MADRIVQEIEVVAKVDDAIKKIDRLEADFKAAMTDIRTETKKTAKSQEKLSDNVDKVGKSFKTAFAAGTTIAFIKRAADLSRDYNRTTIALTQTLANLNREFELKELQEFASEMESLSGISDEVIRQFLLIGANANITGDALKALVRGSLGLSSALGRDATTMMQNLIKTLAGFKEESVKTIPEIASLTSAQLKAGDAIVEVDKKYSKFINTLSGPEGSLGKGVTDLEVSFDNLTESIGNALGDVGLGFILSKAGISIEMFGSKVSVLLLRIKEASTGAFAGLMALAQGTAELLGADPVKEDEDIMLILGDSLAETQAKIAAQQARQTDLFAKLLGLERPGKDKKPGKMDFPTFGVTDDKVDGMTDAEFFAQLDKDMAKLVQGQTELAQMRELARKAMMDPTIFTDERMRELIDSANKFLDDQQQKQLEILRKQKEEEARILEDIANQRERILTRGFMEGGKVFADFATQSIDALFAMRDGQKGVFKEMLKNFLESTGSQLIGSGISDSLQGLSMMIMGNPAGSTLMAVGGTKVGVGLAMKAGSLPIKVPETGAASTAGVGGSQAATSRGGDTGPARAASINIFGAMTTEESAILIERGMRQAHARGFA